MLLVGMLWVDGVSARAGNGGGSLVTDDDRRHHSWRVRSHGFTARDDRSVVDEVPGNSVHPFDQIRKLTVEGPPLRLHEAEGIQSFGTRKQFRRAVRAQVFGIAADFHRDR